MDEEAQGDGHHVHIDHHQRRGAEHRHRHVDQEDRREGGRVGPSRVHYAEVIRRVVIAVQRPEIARVIQPVGPVVEEAVDEEEDHDLQHERQRRRVYRQAEPGGEPVADPQARQH